MVGALRCVPFDGAISNMSTILLDGNYQHNRPFCNSKQGVGGAGKGLLGCASDDALEGLDFSLCLQGIMLSRHLLLGEAAILHAVRVVEEEAGFIVLDSTHGGRSVRAARSREVVGWQGITHLSNRVSSTAAKA